MARFIITYNISLVNVQTNYCNNNLLILDVKQLNKIMKLCYFYTLKALWAGKIKMYMECPGLKGSYQEKGLLRRRALIGRSNIFKLHVALSITKFYTHNITFSDICNFFVMGILICKLLFFVNWKAHWFVFYLSSQIFIVISELFLFCETFRKITY